jgi:hypothetical protein
MLWVFLRPSSGELSALELLHMFFEHWILLVVVLESGWYAVCTAEKILFAQQSLRSAHGLPPILQDYNQQYPVHETICIKSRTVKSTDDGRKDT